MGKKMDWIEACLGKGGWGHRMIKRLGCGTELQNFQVNG